MQHGAEQPAESDHRTRLLQSAQSIFQDFLSHASASMQGIEAFITKVWLYKRTEFMLNDCMNGHQSPDGDENSITKRLGRIIRERREWRGMSQEDLAAAAGLSLMGIHFIETGQRKPGVDSVVRIGRALRCSASGMLADAEFGGGNRAG